jgi:hypothetical protein
MQQIIGGVLAESPIDYNKSLLCLKSSLNREFKQVCSEINGIPTANVAALLFFQVLLQN